MDMAGGGQGDATFELYECSICLESMLEKQPRSLACLHTFCEICLARISSGWEILCPKCRSSTPIPRGDVRALPVNFDLLKIKEREVEIARNASRLCQTCIRRDRMTQAAVLCIQCDRPMCVPCKKDHSRMKLFKSHQYKNFKPVKSEDLLCTIHHQLFAYICLECMIPACLDCILDGGHCQEHEDKLDEWDIGIAKMKNQACESVANLEAYLTRLYEKVRNSKGKLGKVKNSKKEAIEIKVRMENQLCQEVDQLLELLDRDYEDPIKAQMAAQREIISKIKTTVSSFNEIKPEKSKKYLNSLVQMTKDSANLVLSAEEMLGAVLEVPKVRAGTLLGKLVELQTDEACVPASLANLPPVSRPKLVCAIQPDCCVEMQQPQDLVLLDDYSIVVADSGLPFVQRLTATGSLITKYYTDNKANVSSVSVNANNIYIAQEDAVTQLHLSAGPEAKPAKIVYKPGVKAISKMYVTYKDICITSTEGELVYKYDRLLNETVPVFKGVRSFSFLTCINTSTVNCFALTHSEESKIYLFDKTWDLITTIGTLGCEDGELNFPQATVFSSRHNSLLVADCLNHRVSEYELDGTFVRHVLTADDGVECPCGLVYRHPFLWLTQYGSSTVAIKLFQLPD